MKSFITSGPMYRNLCNLDLRQAITLFSLSDCPPPAICFILAMRSMDNLDYAWTADVQAFLSHRWKISFIPTPATPSSTPHTTFIADFLHVISVKSCALAEIKAHPKLLCIHACVRARVHTYIHSHLLTYARMYVL